MNLHSEEDTSVACKREGKNELLIFVNPVA